MEQRHVWTLDLIAGREAASVLCSHLQREEQG